MKIPPGVFSDALFSPCGKYRYWLTRTWHLSRPTVAVIGLNPSKASLERDDNTVRKCYEFVRKRDYGRLLMLNLYAYVATDPDDMWHAHKTGIDITGGVWNSFTALQAYRKAFHVDNTVAAWGREAGARSDDAGRQLQNNALLWHEQRRHTEASVPHSLQREAETLELPMKESKPRPTAADKRVRPALLLGFA